MELLRKEVPKVTGQNQRMLVSDISLATLVVTPILSTLRHLLITTNRNEEPVSFISLRPQIMTAHGPALFLICSMEHHPRSYKYIYIHTHPFTPAAVTSKNTF